MLFEIDDFSRKKKECFGGEFLCKAYFIHTLFRGKPYFIWRKNTLFGNLAVATLVNLNQ